MEDILLFLFCNILSCRDFESFSSTITFATDCAEDLILKVDETVISKEDAIGLYKYYV